MSRNFSEAYDVLKDTGLNNEWHFLSISFDSDFDTADVLKNYSKAYSSNSKRWSFATGNSSVVDEMMLRFGVVVRRPKASITEWDHNLRTVIVGPSGVIRNIYIGNSWTSKTLVEELRRVDKKYLN